jgi:DNA-directed RNA polymerase sigma subunit (sigma70/sigma32)
MNNEYLNNKVFEQIIIRFQKAKKEKNKYDLIMEDVNVSLQITVKSREELKFHYEKIEKNKEISLEYEDAKNHMGRAFVILAQNIVDYAQFNLLEKEDATQEGILVCFEKVDRFEPQKGKAFNYFTTVLLNQLRQNHRSLRNYNELKRRYQQHCEVVFKIKR